MDFVHDQLTDGRAFRVLTVVDQWSRSSPILRCGLSLRGSDVAEALDRGIGDGAPPRSITVDHGMECMSRAREDWAWREEYNTIRPHSSLGHLTPSEYQEICQGKVTAEAA